MWSTTKAGLLGKLAQPYEHDKRVILSPAIAAGSCSRRRPDLPRLDPMQGDVDKIEASGKVPAWLANVHAIEARAATRTSPNLLWTVAGKVKRYDLPDVGLGVDSVPGPERVGLAMEGRQASWLIRGSIKFSSRPTPPSS